MDPNPILYHNPRCSKSRQTLQRLQERGIEPTVVEYLKDSLGVEELSDLARKLGLGVHEMIRAKESVYAELGLTPSTSEEELLDAIARHPVLLERPIVVRGDRAVIGRPPENVDGLF